MAVAVSGANGSRADSRRQVIELAGPAGAGKSTLSTLLVQHLQGAQGSIWGLPVLPLLANGAQLTPTFSSLWLHSRSPLWDETRHMVRLRTLRRALTRPAPHGRGALIFDEGPVFAMAWLRGFGQETLRQDPSAEWWQASLGQWASILDVVVVLDAPDQMLASRIRARQTPHEVKELPDEEIARWMARFRLALEWVLAGMASYGGPMVLRLSSGEPADLLVEKLADELSGSLHAS